MFCTYLAWYYSQQYAWAELHLSSLFSHKQLKSFVTTLSTKSNKFEIRFILYMVFTSVKVFIELSKRQMDICSEGQSTTDICESGSRHKILKHPYL